MEPTTKCPTCHEGDMKKTDEHTMTCDKCGHTAAIEAPKAEVEAPAEEVQA